MFEATSLIKSGSIAFKLLDGLADATNYLLLVWLLGVLIVGTKRQTLKAKSWLAVALSIACVYGVKALDHKLHLWERLSLNYSTHSALAAATVLSLCFLSRSRRAPAIAIFVAYEVLQMVLGFHSVLDILTTLIAVVPLVLVCLKWGIARPLEHSH